MALNFDASPYLNIFNRGRQIEEENRRRPFEDLAQLNQTSQQMADSAQRRALLIQQRQQALATQKQNAELANLKTQEFNNRWRQPETGNLEPQQTEVPAGPSRSLFRSVSPSVPLFNKVETQPQGRYAPQDIIGNPQYGTEYQNQALNYLKATKPTPNYVISNFDQNGGFNGFTNLPPGAKPAGINKPPVPKAPGGVADPARASQNQSDSANLIISKIDQALPKLGYMTTGFFGSHLSGIGGTDAANLKADLETIKAQLGFEQLAQMKSQSRAGASGLGALSDNEMRLLVSARANLDQAQGPDQLRDRLTELRTHYSNWLSMENGVNPYENGQGQDVSQLGNQNQPGGEASGKVQIRDSQGGMHLIPTINLNAARHRDPGLQVIGNGY
jgi:hypothetical protein